MNKHIFSNAFVSSQPKCWVVLRNNIVLGVYRSEEGADKYIANSAFDDLEKFETELLD